MADKIILKNGVVITMDDERKIYDDGMVVIEGDKIIDVGNTSDLEKKYAQEKNARVIDCKKKAIMPGLIDLHYHTAIGKGYNDSAPLYDYLMEFWYPVIRSISPEDAYWAALCSYSESIKAGTTTVNDMWRQMESCADAAEEIGIRAVLSCDVADDEHKLDTLKVNEQLYKNKHGKANGRIEVYVGIEWLPLASKELLVNARALANDLKTGIHVHLNESLGEVELCLEKFGRRSTEFAYDCGLLGPDCVAAHCVWLSDAEIALIRETGTHISHNPSSNAKLGNGIARIPEIMAAGINVGLGHDSAESNNNRDMFEVMKWAGGIHRANKVDASLMPSELVVSMATRNGAKALKHNTGSLEIGKKADVIIIDLALPQITPVVLGEKTNLYSHFVFASSGSIVNSSIIDGQIVMEDRVLKTVNEAEVVEKANQAFQKVLSRI